MSPALERYVTDTMLVNELQVEITRTIGRLISKIRPGREASASQIIDLQVALLNSFGTYASLLKKPEGSMHLLKVASECPCFRREIGLMQAEFLNEMGEADRGAHRH